MVSQLCSSEGLHIQGYLVAQIGLDVVFFFFKGRTQSKVEQVGEGVDLKRIGEKSEYGENILYGTKKRKKNEYKSIISGNKTITENFQFQSLWS